MNDQQHNESFNPEEFPLLSKAGKRNPFKVPDGYFEQLESEVAKRVAGEKTTRPYHFITWLATGAVAAAAIYLAVVTVFKPEPATLQLNNDEYAQVLDSFSSEMDLEDLATTELFDHFDVTEDNSDLFPADEAMEYLEELSLDDQDLASML